MLSIAAFAAGFVSGWVVRSTVDSSRGLAVSVGAGAEALARRLMRTLVAEREFLEDLWAESKARAIPEEERHRHSSHYETSPADVGGAS